MSSVLKAELLAVLKGAGRLAPYLKLDRDDRAFLKRWATDWTGDRELECQKIKADRELECLWQKIEADSRQHGTWNAAEIFQQLIWYAITARHIAKSVESGDDPDLRHEKRRREYLLELAAKADALAEYCRDSLPYSGLAQGLWQKLLMPLLQQLEVRLPAEEDPHVVSLLNLPLVFELTPQPHLLLELYERQAEMLRRVSEPVATTFTSRKHEHRVRNAFVHKITDFLGDLCGTSCDGKPHRQAIAVLANINFPDEDMDAESVRKTLARRSG